ncbi:hypothetical protein [Croceicoccus naphthovorans]|uniref:hypothetical protein n=1 Tax=Croceicoccus naphthovorans TaxID=1348774 RepID=UPI000AB03242|nr:hypothetical protein [Croceicoccus naphthovorans]MBB3988943.1 hypothetical protein [Croceicoccus naphthovorans]
MKWPFRKSNNRPAWDQAFAKELCGATVIVGITYEEPAGDRLEQMFGTVMDADPARGIRLRLEGSRLGETYTLPPDLRAFFAAKSGSYRLRSTGEMVVDPDYTASWTITPPAN